jgi:hypothetical protein
MSQEIIPTPIIQFFWRAASLDEIDAVLASSEVWGSPPRNIFASNIPKVKAWAGRLPVGTVGYEFQTTVVPDVGIPPGRAYWSGVRPGVQVDNNWARISVTVIRVNR